MFSKVIVPLDGSDLGERALGHGLLVAAALSIPMELVEAYDVLPPAVHNRSSRMALEQMLAEQRRRSERYLAEVRERLQPAGCPLTAVSLRGWPEQAIIDHARRDPDALIVMSTHGRGGFARWALGSVTDRVLHTAPNPVLIVRAAAGEAAPAEVSTVLAPLDGSDLAEAALEHAVDLAVALDAGVTLVRVSHTRDYYRNRLVGPASAAGYSLGTWIQELMRGDEEEARDFLAGVRRGLAAERPEVNCVETLHLLHDSPAQAIIDQAALQPTLVAMASHGRSGLGRMVMGSVADRVVRHSSAPVLLIRPHP